MGNEFKAVKLTDRVFWVGAIDWDIREFHGYSTKRGSTYNAYLVLADKIVLIDTVKAPFKDELLSRISSVVDPSKIDYIVSNHSEMDHTGCLPKIIEAVAPEKVFASRAGKKALDRHFGIGGMIAEVGDGEAIDLGGMALTCMETRMLHWPDSMVSFLSGEKILFSQDGFGMHLASGERFDDMLDGSILVEEAARYYANILLPFSGIVKKAVERINGLKLEISMIAPDHGPVWRGSPGRILDLYGRWSSRELHRKAVIVYDTMWGSTAKMARAFGEGLAEGGVSVKILNTTKTSRADAASEILDAGAILAGSPTINNNIFPSMADILTYLKGLKPYGMIGAAFGSYGWSGEAVKILERELAEMKVELFCEGIRGEYVPGADIIDRCRAAGSGIAKKLEGYPPTGW